jgi:hypothetical protein
MKINIWIRSERIDDLANFLSDEFYSEPPLDIEIWYSHPIGDTTGRIVQIQITYDQYKKLEDL